MVTARLLRAIVLLVLTLPAAWAAREAAAQAPQSVEQAESEVRAAEGRFGAGDARVAGALQTLGWAYWRAARRNEAIAAMQRAVELRERGGGGASNPNLAGPLNDLGFFQREQGRLAEASTLLERALAIAESNPRVGPDAPFTATIVSNLSGVRQSQGRGRESDALNTRAAGIRQRALQGAGETREAAQLAYQLAWNYANLGRFPAAVEAMRRAAALAERTQGPDHPDVARDLTDLGFMMRDIAPVPETEAVLRRAVALGERSVGGAHPQVASALTYLGQVQQRAGRIAEAEATSRRAIAIIERALGADHPQLTTPLRLLGSLLTDRGVYGDAEQALQRAITIAERRIGQNSAALADLLATLSYCYQQMGRPAVGETLLRRALAIRERVNGPTHPFTVSRQLDIANNLILQNRPAEAMAMLERALPIVDAERPLSARVSVAYMLLARASRGIGDLERAETAARRAVATREQLVGPNDGALAGPLLWLGRTIADRGRPQEGEPMLRRYIALRERALGPDHPDIGWGSIYLAWALEQQGRPADALAAADRAVAVMSQRGANARGGDGDESAERLSFRYVFATHAVLVERALRAGRGERDALLAQAFASMQRAKEGATSAALARMAERFASGDDRLAGVLRERADGGERAAALDQQLRAALSAGGAGAAAVREQIAAQRRALAQLDRRLAREFPSYARMLGSGSLRLEDVQRALGPDEAMLDYLVTDSGTMIMVVRADRADLISVPEATRAAVQRQVRTVRAGVDPQGVTGIATLPRFDFAAAHALYRGVFAPAETALAGASHIMIVADGALSGLPFALLVSAPVADGADDAGFARHRAAPWLARRYAFTTLPSGSAVRALREVARPRQARDPFVGFGDPALSGPPGQSRGIVASRIFTRGVLADTRSVRELSPLPDTADELRALGRALGAGAGALYLRDQATEPRVRTSDLSRYRVVAFATHGLTAGEISGFAEPGLILTPPERASAGDDGVLTASEIAALRLDADWVILSACNTAAPDGTPGSEALSGLARAFFYAGTRALLVSHWAVASAATVRLTTGTLAEAQRNPDIGRAEALRRAMVLMIEDSTEPFLAHPLFWAPFVVVGEGGRPIAVAPIAEEAWAE